MPRGLRIPGIERPVFVIAPPRSGSTLLFDMLAQFDELRGLMHREAEHVWWHVLPYHKRQQLSDYVSPVELTSLKRLELKALFYGVAVAGAPSMSAAERARALLSTGRIRYLDKTISNCFHLEAIREVFPDAKFVFVVRDPRPNIASMIEGWPELHRFGKAQLTPYISAANGRLPHWTYPAPPGWLSMVDRPLPEVCAWSWRKHVEAILDFRSREDDAPLVRYEDLIANPLDVVRDLATHLELSMTRRVADYVAAPPLSRTTVSAPSPTKWRETHGESVVSSLPIVGDTAARLGYAV
jgi:hypothetical protein